MINVLLKLNVFTRGIHSQRAYCPSLINYNLHCVEHGFVI